MGPKLLKAYLKYVKAVSNSLVVQINAVIQEINENVKTHVQNGEVHFDSPFEDEIGRKIHLQR
jgi:hypothetical protein